MMNSICWINLKIVAVLAVAVLLNFGLVPDVKAQSTGLQISPTNDYVWVPGGTAGLAHFQLTNVSDDSMVVFARAQSFKPDENGTPQLQSSFEFPYLYRLETKPAATAEGSLDVVQKYNLDQGFIVDAHSTKDIWLAIEPPIGVMEREYPISLMFVANQDNNTQQSGSSLGTAVGANLVVLVAESNEDQSRLTLAQESFPSVIDSFMGYDLQAMIENDGPTGTIINGKMQLVQNDQVVQEWEFAQDLVLGRSQRLARANTAIDHMNRPNLSTVWRPSKMLFGSYELRIYVRSAHPQNEGGYVTRTFAFYALPYYAIAVTLTFILLLALIVSLTKASRRKSKLRKSASDKLKQVSTQNSAFVADKK